MSIKNIWRDYSLSVVLLALFLVSWAIQTWAGWEEFVAEEANFGREAEVFGFGGYVWSWAQATFENWQSEFLQLLSMAVLTSFLIHKGSAESRDGQDEMMDRIVKIQAQVEALSARQNESAQEDKKRSGTQS